MEYNNVGIITLQVSVPMRNINALSVKNVIETIRSSCVFLGSDQCKISLCDDDKNASSEEVIDKFLSFIGSFPYLKGHRYIKAAIATCVQNENLIYAITKGLYPRIAREFSTSAYAIEGSIRKLINILWSDEEKREKIKIILGDIKEKPSNTEFICKFAALIKKKIK